MSTGRLNHYTLRCSVTGLAPLLDFYTRVLGLSVGARPDIPAPGYWLYSEGQAVVHLYAIGDLDGAAPGSVPTGSLDHISFSATGVEATRAHLVSLGVPHDEAPVPGWPLHQIFLRDPAGLKVELTFSLDAPAAPEPKGPPGHG